MPRNAAQSSPGVSVAGAHRLLPETGLRPPDVKRASQPPAASLGFLNAGGFNAILKACVDPFTCPAPGGFHDES